VISGFTTIVTEVVLAQFVVESAPIIWNVVVEPSVLTTGLRLVPNSKNEGDEGAIHSHVILGPVLTVKVTSSPTQIASDEYEIDK
jgi:hypothetical protein